MSIIRLSSLAGLALLACSPAFAFELDYHTKMTREVLGDKALSATLNDGTVVRFSQKQIDEFVKANEQTDKGMFGYPKLHFDNEDLVTGSGQARGNRKHVIDALKADSSLVVWHPQMGFLLHATQDFYAHSSWVNVHTGPTVIASLSEVTADSRLLPKSQIGDVCEPDATTLIPGQPVTSGYFSLVEGAIDHFGIPLLKRVVDSDPEEPGKCNHGYKSVPGGINKDRPPSHPAGGTPQHQVAYDRAKEATRDLIVKMLAELKGNDAALCRFTGDEKNCSRWMYRFTNFISVPFAVPGLPYVEKTRIRRYPLGQNTTSQDITTEDLLGTAGRGEVTFERPNSTTDVELRACRRGDKWLPFTRSYSISSAKPSNTFTAYNLVSCPTNPVGTPPFTAPITLRFTLTESGVLTVTRTFDSEQAVACAANQATGTVSQLFDAGLELDLKGRTLDFHEKEVHTIDIRSHSQTLSSRAILDVFHEVARADSGTYDITLTSGSLNRISGTTTEDDEGFPPECQEPLVFCPDDGPCAPPP